MLEIFNEILMRVTSASLQKKGLLDDKEHHKIVKQVVR